MRTSKGQGSTPKARKIPFKGVKHFYFTALKIPNLQIDFAWNKMNSEAHTLKFLCPIIFALKIGAFFHEKKSHGIKIKDISLTRNKGGYKNY